MITIKKTASNDIRLWVTFFLLWMFLVSNVYASSVDIFGGTLVQGTPFDYKLSQAGFFQEISQVLPGSVSPEPIDSLFLKARSFRYTHEKGDNHWRSAEETEMRHAGDCKDKSLWLYTQLKKNGYSNVRLVVGRYRTFDKTFHAWVTYTDASNVTYLLDPTIQKRVWTGMEFSSGFYTPLYSFDGQQRYRYSAL